jgi:hypothetical protein
MASSFSFDPSNLEKGLSTFENKAKIAIKMKVNQCAEDLVVDAKLKAPWTDRTGQARRMLNSYFYELQSGGYRIALSHGVNYGIWLELAHEKNFAIIQPTIETTGRNKIIPSFEKFIEKLKG